MALLEHGGLVLGKVAGVQVRLHWTAVVGAYVFTGFRFDPVAWGCFFGLVFAHELGHALVVKACRATATAIELTGFGGLCYWRGDVSATGRAAIAWGGVWAQLVVLALAEAYWHFAQPRLDWNGWRVLLTLTSSNAWMAAFNLVPLAPLDGAEAWRLPVLLGRWLRGLVGGAPSETLVRPPVHDEAEEAFEAGERRNEVKGMVSQLLDDARKEPPK